MSNSYFQFKQFIIHQDRCAMKVTTDGCLFGAWAAARVGSQESLVGSILDVGTGTGLLSFLIAQQCRADITAFEIDKDAFEQATENVDASPWSNKIKVFHADAGKFDFPNQYDVIISNPPFYENELKGENIKKNLAHHNDGLLLPELISIIKKNLKPDGSFYLLLPFKRNGEIRRLLTESDLTIQHLTFVRQTTKHNFSRIMLEGNFRTNVNTEIMVHEISIKNEQDQYTPAFIDLLKDYYLHL